MPRLDLLLAFAGVILSLMVFSYLLGDKLFFGIAMYILVGVSSGYAALVMVKRVLYPLLILPLMDIPQLSGLLGLVPLILSLSMLWALFRKSSKAATLPLGILAGSLVALAVVGISRGTLAPQILSIIDAFDPARAVSDGLPDWMAIFEAFMMLLGVIAVLFFFHHRRSGWKASETNQVWLDGLSGVGQVFIGITFGAVFVGLFGTGLTALIATIERIINFVKLWL